MTQRVFARAFFAQPSGLHAQTLRFIGLAHIQFVLGKQLEHARPRFTIREAIAQSQRFFEQALCLGRPYGIEIDQRLAAQCPPDPDPVTLAAPGALGAGLARGDGELR
ncbi:MAG TPA: hypothetical protein PK954_02205, partial [Anaerolineales bacterium]|nr:hypothetical protein [Anaerolineales bacterium]